MLTPTPARAVWPARLAYCAAAIFTLASAGTNLNFGISKGADGASSAVWAAVSIAVSIVFALSWPALIRSIQRRQWTLALTAAAALALTGAYSVTAALGSASGARANADATEQVITDQRARAQAAYDSAKAEIDGLRPSRPIGELEALLPGRSAGRNCHIQLTIGSRTTICSPPARLAAELGRARRRAELEAKMSAAQAELGRVGAPKQANSDAAALAGYLAAIGLNVPTDAVNRLLVLLAVLVVECGGGLALAVGMSLSNRHEQGVRERVFANDRASRSLLFGANTANTTKVGAGTRFGRSPNTPVFVPVPNCSRSRKAVGVRLIEDLRNRGGRVQTSIRRLAQQLGTTPTTLHTVAGELAAAGVVRVDAGRQGSLFRLIVA